MPVFFQHQINQETRLGIWKIEETEEFFRDNVPQHRDVSHPHKRLQHLAGRFLLRYLFADFPYELIRIADTKRPFIEDEPWHFSISHCGDFAAAIVSKTDRVGIDIEIPVPTVQRISSKFLHKKEKENLPGIDALEMLTLYWSVKESVFKWYGDGNVDFSDDITIRSVDTGNETVEVLFNKIPGKPAVSYRLFDKLVLAWTI